MAYSYNLFFKKGELQFEEIRSFMVELF